MQSKTFIYALVCPFSGKYRYIGKSNNPQKRLFGHMTDSRINHRNSWLKSIKLSGALPLLEIIDEVEMSEWPFWEKHYISLYKSFGFNLLNVTEGGEGSSFHDRECKRSFSGDKNPMFGKKRPEVGERNKALRVGKKYSEIYGVEKAKKITEKIKTSLIGKSRMSNDARKRMSERMRGVKFSDETRKKMSERNHLRGKSGESHPYSLKINQHDINGKFIKEWASISEASMSLCGKRHSYISAALKDEKRTAFGFKWSYKQKK